MEDDDIKTLASALFEGQNPQRGKTIMIAGARQNIQIIEEVARICTEKGVNFVLDITDYETEMVLVNNADEAGIDRLVAERLSLYEPIRTRLEARSLPGPSIAFNPTNNDRLKKGCAPLQSRLASKAEDGMQFCLTVVPTEHDAEIDGMEMKPYMTLFVESCHQPWSEIRAAQQKLIERFNAGKKVHITNDDGTDLTFDIEGFSFINEAGEYNVPGAEFFQLQEGKVLTELWLQKGIFKYDDSPVIKDITLVFKDGKVVEFDAAEGKEALEQIITRDDGNSEGARYLGELAFEGIHI